MKAALFVLSPPNLRPTTLHSEKIKTPFGLAGSARRYKAQASSAQFESRERICFLVAKSLWSLWGCCFIAVERYKIEDLTWNLPFSVDFPAGRFEYVESPRAMNTKATAVGSIKGISSRSFRLPDTKVGEGEGVFMRPKLILRPIFHPKLLSSPQSCSLELKQ